MSASLTPEDVISWINSQNDVSVLNRIIKAATEQRERIRRGEASWNAQAFDELWRGLSDDQKRFIREVYNNGGRITRNDLMQRTGWTRGKVTGLLAGINTRARNMRYKDVITRRDVRRNGDWDIEYELDSSILNLVRSGQISLT